jgi:hypothetical protein
MCGSIVEWKVGFALRGVTCYRPRRGVVRCCAWRGKLLLSKVTAHMAVCMVSLDEILIAECLVEFEALSGGPLCIVPQQSVVFVGHLPVPS